MALFLYAGMSVLVKKAQKAQKAKNKEMGQVTHRKFDAETLAANEKMFSRHLQYLHLHSEYLINKEKFDSKRIAVSNEPAATPSTPSEKKSAQQAAKFVHTGISHIFAKKHFDRPTWCSFCGRFLWGIGKQVFISFIPLMFLFYSSFFFFFFFLFKGYGCKASGCSYAAHSECVRVLQMGSPSYFTCNRSGFQIFFVFVFLFFSFFFFSFFVFFFSFFVFFCSFFVFFLFFFCFFLFFFCFCFLFFVFFFFGFFGFCFALFFLFFSFFFFFFSSPFPCDSISCSQQQNRHSRNLFLDQLKSPMEKHSKKSFYSFFLQREEAK